MRLWAETFSVLHQNWEGSQQDTKWENTRCEGCLLPGARRTHGCKQTALVSLQPSGGRRRKVKAVRTNHSASVLAFARVDFQIRSAPLEGTKRITVHFYLQAGHEGNVGVNVLLKKTRVPAAAQMRITPQSAISFQALHHDWLWAKSIPDCQCAQIRASGPLPIKEPRCFGAITDVSRSANCCKGRTAAAAAATKVSFCINT